METRLCNFGKTQTTISNSRSLRLKELKNPYSEFSSVFSMDYLKESLGNLHMLFNMYILIPNSNKMTKTLNAMYSPKMEETMSAFKPSFTGKNSRKPSMVKKMVICKFPRGITINEKAGHLPLMFLLIIYINVRGTNH